LSDYDTIDYFTDQSLVADPYPYFDHLRSKCPVSKEPHHGVVAVTGWEEANAVYKDTESFSSCVAVAGPFTPMPFTPDGDDICAQIQQHRTEIPMYEHMLTTDPRDHTRARSLLSRLLTPKRLKENEDFMWRLADRHIDESSPTANASSWPLTPGPFPCWSSPTWSVARKKTTRSSATPSGPRGRAHGSEHSTSSRSPPTRWNGPTRRSAATSKTGGANRATTS
jgi:hypothetical protein